MDTIICRYIRENYATQRKWTTARLLYSQQRLRSSQCCYFTIYIASKKRAGQGSSDSLGIIASIANQSATEYNDMCKRHAALDEQFRTKRLQTVNVESDGNCLFRAVSYLLTGSEDSSHASLRASVASHIESTGKVLGGVINITPEDLVSRIRDIRTAGICVGEEAIVVLPDVIKRDVHVYTAFAEPLIYHIASGIIIGPPIHIAFYAGIGTDPAHYKAILETSEATTSPHVSDTVANSSSGQGN